MDIMVYNEAGNVIVEYHRNEHECIFHIDYYSDANIVTSIDINKLNTFKLNPANVINIHLNSVGGVIKKSGYQNPLDFDAACRNILGMYKLVY